MFHFAHLQRRVLSGLLAGGLFLGATTIQPGDALAGFSTSPGPRLQSGALLANCTTGDHIKQVVIER